MYTILLCISELHLSVIKSAYPQGTVTLIIREGSASVGCCLFYLITFLIWSGLCHKPKSKLYCLGNLAVRFLKMKFTNNRLCTTWYCSWKESQHNAPVSLNRWGGGSTGRLFGDQRVLTETVITWHQPVLLACPLWPTNRKTLTLVFLGNNEVSKHPLLSYTAS